MATVSIGQFEVNLKKKLGSGGFGTVYGAKELAGESPCAAKQVRHTDYEFQKSVETEVRMLRAAGKHEFICCLLGHEVLESHENAELAKSSFVFMEMASGGELFDRLIDSGTLSEKALLPYLFGIVEALGYLHSIGIVHRDVKLENVLLVAEDPRSLKLIDFGLAVQLEKDPEGHFIQKKFFCTPGSKSYRAPEILTRAGYLAPPVDVWAVGVVAFTLAAGFFPLDEARNSDWRFARLAKDTSAGMSPCDSIYSVYKRKCSFSPDLKEVIDGMLAIDPSKRLTMAEVRSRPLLNRVFEAGGEFEDADADGERVVYRSAGGLDDSDDESTFELPELAVPISRQRAAAALDDDDAPPA